MGKSWFVYEVAEDGTLRDGEIFFDASQIEAPGAADGLKVDAQGNLWATGPGGVLVINPNGQHLGTIKLPQSPANVAWGDSDGQTLYMTAGDKLYRIRVNVAGDGW
jgi:gluconolactonase